MTTGVPAAAPAETLAGAAVQRGAMFATVTFTRPVELRPEAASTAATVTRKVAGPRE